MKFSSRILSGIALLSTILVTPISAQNWIEVRSPNFSVVTDGGAKNGREVALRFEQMRKVFGELILRNKVNMNVPLQIIAFKDGRGIKQVSPLWKGKPVENAGIYFHGEDLHFIALDLSSENGWPVVFHEYAHLLLDANYPKTDVWFDEGFAEYYSTIEISKKEVRIGKSPPYAGLILQEGLMPVQTLFTIRHDSKEYNETGPKRHTLYSQSWLMVHYLFDNKKMAETGEYFNLINNKHVPVAEAIKQAYGVTPKEFDKTLQRYYDHNEVGVAIVPAPDFESSLYVNKKIKDYEADAIIADIHLHSADRLDQAAGEFEKVLEKDPDMPGPNRGLGYYYLHKGDREKAGHYFRRAAALGSTDARVYFMLAQFTFYNVLGAQKDAGELVEMTRMIDRSIELDPNYAESYNLRSFVMAAAGNFPEAITALRNAIRLSPREENYKVNLAHQFQNAGKYDDAIAMWEVLKLSSNPGIAEMAVNQVELVRRWKEKPLNRLEGLVVLETTDPQWRRPPGTKEDSDAKRLENKQNGEDESSEVSKPDPSKPDTRAVKYLKGTLSEVDCAKDSSAVLTVVSSGKTYKFYVKSVEKAIVIGEDKLSCMWVNIKVAVNYKARDANSGDVISVEVN